ncbi:hypothetical protein [Streptomyces griseosporeus]
MTPHPGHDAPGSGTPEPGAPGSGSPGPGAGSPGSGSSGPGPGSGSSGPGPGSGSPGPGSPGSGSADSRLPGAGSTGSRLPGAGSGPTAGGDGSAPPGGGLPGLPGLGADDPAAPFDDIRRLRVMAGAVRGARLVERVVPAPLDEVWAVMGDLEGEFGRFQPDMRRVRLLRADGDRVEALARSRYGLRAHLRGVLRPGWCWLQSRFLIVGMAAAADGDTTRVALTGGLRLPGRAAVVPFGTRGELDRALHRLEHRVHDRRQP